MKTKLLILIALLSSSQLVFSQAVDINGFVRNYTGILYENGDFNMLQNTLNLNFEARGDRIAFKANPMLYLYGIDSLDFRLREIYLDLYFKS
ncbi:MAG: hypothetical protein DRI87_05285, partial [Bacteroidetes bacterium]